MSDTPKTDAVQGGLECATERPEDWEKCFQWMAGHARSLERELESTKRLLNFWKSVFHESRVVARVEDTPITDAAVVRFTVASEIDRSPAGEWVAAGVARGLEQERNAVLADIRNADDQLMRWFKAASPYATPGSLEEGLKKLEASACPTPKGCSLFGCKDAAPQAEQIGDVKGPRNEGSPADAAAAWMCSRYNCQLAGRCCHRGSCEVGE